MGPLAVIMGLIIYKHPTIAEHEKMIEEVLAYYPECTL